MIACGSQLFLDYVHGNSPLVEAALDRYSQYGDDCPPTLRQAIRHSLLAPGKRLRPLLVLLAAGACGCPPRAALPAACAVEMVHTYSLIHDDLPAMDNDQCRRGRPCCHVQFGEAQAILAGDALLAQAFEILADEVQPADVAVRCCQALARAAGPGALVGGQADDLECAGNTGDLARLEHIHRRKTGALFRVSLQLGGLIAGAERSRLDALDAFGQKLGLAFQIIDDLLDEQGNASSLGKSVGKDRKQAKLTFPALLGEARSQQRAAALIDEAQAELRAFGDRAGCLQSLAQYVLERNH